MTTGGLFLSTSDRGHAPVAAFALKTATDLLASIAWVPSAGRTPRFIGLDPEDRLLSAANADDGTIIRHLCDPSTNGLPSPSPVARDRQPNLHLVQSDHAAPVGCDPLSHRPWL
jgi:6-phosphogluconolactonase